MTARADARRAAALAVDVMVESDLWATQPESATIVDRAIAAAARCLPAQRPAEGELAVVLADDATVRALNRHWRAIDAPTNVLSFPARRPAIGRTSALLGDIVIAFETMTREAAAENKPFAHHLAHVAVHGFLHLLGYDHQSDDAAGTMERLERRVLALLDVPDPYVMGDSGPNVDRHA